MSQMLVAIFLVHSNSGITSGKKFRRELKMAAILKMSKYYTKLQFDIRNEKIIPNYAWKSIFMLMKSSMTSQGDLKVASLYSIINVSKCNKQGAHKPTRFTAPFAPV